MAVTSQRIAVRRAWPGTVAQTARAAFATDATHQTVASAEGSATRTESLLHAIRLPQWLLPNGDPQQAIRMRRFLLAAATYAVCIPLVILAHSLELLSFWPTLAVVAAILGINGLLFALFRSGVNLRFADPSLTFLQTMAAMFVVLCCVYDLDQQRTLALILCPVVLMFGIFRFSMRDFFLASALVLMGYAAVIVLLLLFKPATVQLAAEVFGWIELACVLPCFAFIGGTVSELRAHLRRSNDELGSALAAVQRLATHDSLTGLANRSQFQDRLQQAVSRAERRDGRVALLYIDLDHLKEINDSLGHHVDDIALKEAARRVTECVRESHIAARFGGDEFVLLLEEFGDQKALADLAQRVLAAIRQPLPMQDREIRMSASIGVCTFPAHAQDARALLSNADNAMYRAKAKGRDTWHLYSPSDVRAKDDRVFEADLRRALHDGELRVHYQPKINLATGRVAGVEALLRWQHREHGLLPPERFIRAAEENGMIVPVGLWALRQACADAKSWQHAGLSFPVAVNLSAPQFHHGGLAAQLHEILRATGLPARQLEIEITETMVMQDPAHAVELMRALRRMGVRLALDDFGIGYSSLAQLKTFPVNTLKLDQSFVRDLPEDVSDVAITRAIIAMAHTLHIKVVAEGVENAAQLELLRSEGCDEFQGFYCSEPLPSHELVRWLSQRK